MRYFPFKILIVCIILPPVLYILSIQLLEDYLNNTCYQEIEGTYLGDSKLLFDGSKQLVDVVNANIDNYLRHKEILNWGVKARVTVVTGKNRIIYPLAMEEESLSYLHQSAVKVAEDNYALLNEGLQLNVEIQVLHSGLLANLLLGFYILLFLSVLYYFYRTSLAKGRAEEAAREQEIKRLLALKQDDTNRLESLQNQRAGLEAELVRLKSEHQDQKNRATRNEDEMLEEMVGLEEKLNENIQLQEKQQDEITALKERLEQYDKLINKGQKQKAKSADVLAKRFNTLYKNVSMNDRAVDGFLDLTDELQLKAEEIIHQLNGDPKTVTIKRKVFGKKNRETVFEVLFAYKGRLYFRKRSDNRIEVLAIGTKHTQGKDLEFLDRL